MEKDKVRASNFEALRIVCMLFIVAGHLIMWHDFNSESFGRVMNCGVRLFFMVAINCFVLISGWFGIKLKFNKILSLNNSLTFWSLVIGVVAVVMGLHSLEPRKDVLMLVPLLTRRYWFVTVYVALCVLASYLNKFADALNKDEFKKLLVACTCLFVVLPTLGAVFNFDALTLDSGYGIVNFVFLYLLGRYLKLYSVPDKSTVFYLMSYVILMAVGGFSQVFYSRVLGFEFTTLISYDTFFVFFGAVFLFCSFSRMEFKNKHINTLASACLAVYIIHIHPWVGGWTFETLIGLSDMDDMTFVLALVIVPIITYLGCFVLERVRVLIFKGFKELACSVARIRVKQQG